MNKNRSAFQGLHQSGMNRIFFFLNDKLKLIDIILRTRIYSYLVTEQSMRQLLPDIKDDN